MGERTANFVVKRAALDTLKDGREVLFVELELENGEVVHDVIETQEKLDRFLESIGYAAGGMRLKTGEEGKVIPMG